MSTRDGTGAPMSERGERDVLDEWERMKMDGAHPYGFPAWVLLADRLATELRATRADESELLEILEIHATEITELRQEVAALRSKLDAGVRGWATKYHNSDPIYFKPGDTRTNSKAGDVRRAVLLFTDDNERER